MSLTEKQLAARNRGIGASDAGTILGLNPFKSASDLWHELTGRVKVQDISSKPAVRMGNALEGAAGDLASERLGVKLVRPTSTFVAKNGFMRANVDFMLEKAQKGARIVEAKTTGMSDDWGDDGSDVIPERVRVQLHHQFICAESDFGYAAAIFGSWGLGFGLYECPRSESLCQVIEEAEANFWFKHVLADVPVPDSMPSHDILKRVIPEAGKAIVIDWGLAAAFTEAKRVLKEAEEKKEAAEDALRNALGDAELATAGEFTITKKLQKRGEYTVKPTEFYVLKCELPKAAKAKKGSAA